jgi:hypothetical protein
MNRSSTNQPNTSRLARILTDVHLWVLLLVLAGGLLLLRYVS